MSHRDDTIRPICLEFLKQNIGDIDDIKMNHDWKHIVADKIEEPTNMKFFKIQLNMRKHSMLSIRHPPYVEKFKQYLISNNKIQFVPYCERAFETYFSPTTIDDLMEYETDENRAKFSMLFDYVLLFRGIIYDCEFCIPMLVNREYCHIIWCFYPPYVEFMQDFYPKKARILMIYEVESNNFWKTNYELVFSNEYLVKNIIAFL